MWSKNSERRTVKAPIIIVIMSLPVYDTHNFIIISSKFWWNVLTTACKYFIDLNILLVSLLSLSLALLFPVHFLFFHHNMTQHVFYNQFLFTFQFGMFETVASGLADKFPKQLNSRKVQTTAFLCIFLFILGIPFTTNVINFYLLFNYQIKKSQNRCTISLF